MKLRSFGNCYICGHQVFGFVLRPARPYATSTKARYAAEDSKGVRHSTCAPSGQGQVAASR